MRPIGLSQAMAHAVAVARGSASGAPLRVTVAHRETLHVHAGVADFSSRMMLRLQCGLADDGDALAVGDWLVAAPDRHGDWWAHARVALQTRLASRAV